MAVLAVVLCCMNIVMAAAYPCLDHSDCKYPECVSFEISQSGRERYKDKEVDIKTIESYHRVRKTECLRVFVLVCA